MKKVVLIVVLLIVIVGGGAFAYSRLNNQDFNNNNTEAPATSQQAETPDAAPENTQTGTNFNFEPAKKSAHYVSNTPEHGTIFDTVPGEVVINFNFDLSSKSTISVMKDGKEVSDGDIIISADKLVMSKKIIPGSGSGLYSVVYDACWPDGSCHDGQFQFGVK